jgi:hypothetical protein
LRFFVSTTTDLLRPWLKFCRTVLCSTPGRLMVSVFFVSTLSVLSSFELLSLIPIPFPLQQWLPDFPSSLRSRRDIYAAEAPA